MPNPQHDTIFLRIVIIQKVGRDYNSGSRMNTNAALTISRLKFDGGRQHSVAYAAGMGMVSGKNKRGKKKFSKGRSFLFSYLSSCYIDQQTTGVPGVFSVSPLLIYACCLALVCCTFFFSLLMTISFLSYEVMYVS